MDNTQTQLIGEQQIAVLLIIGAGFEDHRDFGGFDIKAVVDKLEQSTQDPAEQAGWAAVTAKLLSGVQANVALAESGLFEPAVNRMFMVVENLDKATETAIDFLRFRALSMK